MARLLWCILCINLWGFAIFGAIFTVMGVLGYSTARTLGRWLLGQPVQTPEQNFAWLIWSLAFMFLGLIWAYLHASGRVLFRPDEQGNLEPPQQQEPSRGNP